MATNRGALSVGLQAVQATFRGITTVLPLMLTYGALLTALDVLIYSSAMPSGQMPGQEDLIRVLLPWAGVTLGLEIFLGPIIAACAVYVGRAFALRRDAQLADPAGEASRAAAPSLYKAINFALNRYGRMFVPHAAAQLSIQLGLIIVIPGILFQMQYAFVDSVASIEDEAGPLNRSKRLTRGRRRSVFLLFLPWLLLSQVMIFVDLWAMGQSHVHLFGVKSAAFLLYFMMQVSFYLLYHDRTSRRRRSSTASAGPAEPAEPANSP